MRQSEARRRRPCASGRTKPRGVVVGATLLASLLAAGTAGTAWVGGAAAAGGTAAGPGTAAAARADRDGDGLTDDFETRWGVTDPDDPDSDGDGVVDPAEDSDGDHLGNLGEQRFGTHPGSPDSDADGRPDGREDTDRDGRSDAQEQDQRRIPAHLRPSLGKATQDIWAHQRDCGAKPAATAVTRCSFAETAAAPGLAVVGDSKAMMLMPAFIAASKLEGWGVVTLLKGSCSPILGTLNGQAHALDGGAACRQWRDHAIDWLNSHPPALIVIVHSDDYQLVDAAGRILTGARKVQAWGQGVRRTLAALPAMSEVLLLGDAPRNSGNPVRCLRRHRDDMSACVTARQPGPRRTVERAIQDAARRGSGHFRTLHDQICTYDPCPLVQGDTLIWRDGGHLTITFARRLAPSMRKLLTEVLAEVP